MKKGFTLIELLAVIVILAIIAVIAVPIVLNIIDETKNNAGLRSAEMYVKAVELSIANSTLKDINIPDGEYILKDGDICIGEISNNKCNGKILEVEVNGKVPESGTITIANGNISDLSIVLNEKTIVKNSEGKLVYKDAPVVPTAEMVCTPVEVATTGNVPSGNYTAGDEYMCEVKEDTSYRFFVLEDGDNTTLTKGHTGTTGIGEVSLIMDSNLEGTTTWCLSGEYDGETCKADGVYTFISNKTTEWENVEVTAPTAYQIAAVCGTPTWPNSMYLEYDKPLWVRGDYWTTTDGQYSINEPNSPGYSFAFVAGVTFISGIDPDNNITCDDVVVLHGVRPVITVSKDKIG